MEIVRSPAEMTAWADSVILSGKKIGLVPTMGYFHEGHLALMRMAGKLADRVVVSLFVNPIQFGPGEDLDQYPRDFERDVAMAKSVGVDVVFAPEAAQMYPEQTRTTIHVADITDTLCGASRPGHFTGVATVVAKLFHIIKPQLAVFGRKDFQQLAVIRRMVKDLNWDVEIIGHPIVREPDGLAMSSRNTYLDPESREKALCLHRCLQMARAKVHGGMNDANELVFAIREEIGQQTGVAIDYVSIVDKDSLRQQTVINENSWLAMAVKVGKTRLIDNGGLLEGDKENP